MNKLTLGWGLAAFFLAMMGLSGWWASVPNASAQQTDGSVSTGGVKPFMRKKLDASSQILEGLTTEDANLIITGGNALLNLSSAEKWQVLTDAEYRDHSRDFRNSVKKLVDAAEKKNFDNAALQWFDVTKSCIECHKHVRVQWTKK